MTCTEEAKVILHFVLKTNIWTRPCPHIFLLLPRVSGQKRFISLSPAQVRTQWRRTSPVQTISPTQTTASQDAHSYLVWNNFVNIAASALTTVYMTERFQSAGDVTGY